jgi:hypothetical protein
MVETVTEDVVWRAAPGAWRRAWEPPLDRILDRGQILDAPIGPLSPARAALGGELAAAEADRVIAAARLIANGRAGYFGYPVVDVPAGVVSRDPFTGRSWPDVHGKRLDYRRATGGDPKWAWEANRLQRLPLLSLAARLSGDGALDASSRERALAWVRSARPPYGIAWSNGFEAALRGISLALVYDTLRGTPAPADATFTRALWQHARWIERDRSFGSSANNHLLGEAVGLLTISILAPELRAAERWERQALAVISQQADMQILRDGTSPEQAFAYHLFVCDLLLLATALLGSDRTPPAVISALRRAGDAIAAQVAGGEPDPAYGDSDDGRAFLFDADEIRSAPGVASSIACAVGHRACAELAGAPDLPAILLFGTDGVSRFGDPDGVPAAQSSLLGDGGIVVLRRRGVRALFDVGAIGYLQIAAHGHADGLSLVVSDGADELVVDPGTGTYFGDATRRHQMRGTEAHSTLSVGGADQARYGGPFLWLDHPDIRLVDVDIDAGVAVGEVRSAAGSAVRHRRAVLMLPTGAILIYDRVDGAGAEHLVLTWPLHPALRISRRGGNVVDGHIDGRLRLVISVAGTRRDHVADPQLTTVEGEWSRRLERVDPAPVVRATLAGGSPAEVATLLVPAQGRHIEDPQLVLEGSGEVTTAGFVLDGSIVRVHLDVGADPVAIVLLPE